MPPRLRTHRGSLLAAALLLASALPAIVSAPAAAGRVPPDVQEDLAQLQAAHGSPVLVVTQHPDVLDELGRWLKRAPDALFLSRRLPSVGTLSYERSIVLERTQLRCGVEVGPTWRLEPFGDCGAWTDGPTELSPVVPRQQPTSPRGSDFERGAALAVGPATGLGTVIDLSVEARTSRKGSAAFTYTAVQVREWGSPALMAGQARRYFLGDVDRGVYGPAQVGVLSTELGTVRSPGAAVGLGLKYTTQPGLMADAYLGAGPAWPVRIHPAVGGRVGWAF